MSWGFGPLNSQLRCNIGNIINTSQDDLIQSLPFLGSNLKPQEILINVYPFPFDEYIHIAKKWTSQTYPNKIC